VKDELVTCFSCPIRTFFPFPSLFIRRRDRKVEIRAALSSPPSHPILVLFFFPFSSPLQKAMGREDLDWMLLEESPPFPFTPENSSSFFYPPS